MLDFPLVSVIMTYYDHEDYLADSVRSVANLDYPNVELIVIDDCSPNRKADEILASFSLANSRVIRLEKNRGHVASKNVGIDNSAGELILPLDSDDLILPNYLRETVPLCLESGVGVVLTDVKLFGDQSSVYTPAQTKEQFVCLKTPSNTFLARRELFEELGPYDETLQYGDETDFLLRVLENNWKIRHVPLPLYEYRKHENGLSLSVSYVKLLSDLIDRHPQVFQENLKVALLYREQRYWGEIESAKEFDKDCVGGGAEVTARQYQHLHSEFHKLLRHYEELQVESQSLQQQIQALMSGKMYRFRDRVYRMLRRR